MKPIKVGIVGLGFVGAAHLDALRRVPGVEVAGVAQSSLEKARQKAAEFGIPGVYGDYRELLSDPEIDVIHNCTPNHMHLAVTRDALLARKHVLSEKPLGMNSRETAELVHLANNQDLVTGVCFNYRQYPLVQQMRAMIAGGEIGKVHLVYGSYLQDWLLQDADWNWRLEQEQGGDSRAVADIGSHWMDTVQHVTGHAITEVFADLCTVIPIRYKPAGQVTTFGEQGEAARTPIPVTTEDYASVLFRMENGVRGVFTVSNVSAGRKNRLKVEVAGSTGTLAWNQEEPQRLWVGRRSVPNQELLRDPTLLAESARPYAHYPGGHEEGWPDGMRNLMRNFYAYLRMGPDRVKMTAPFATFAQAHQITKLVEAILLSHQTSRWVRCDGSLTVSATRETAT